MKLDPPDFLRPWKHCSAGVFVYDLAVCQEKGLLKDEGDELMSSAYSDGYGFKVDQLVHE